MSETLDLSINHYSIINPLIKWRILGLKELMKESEYKNSYNAFCQLIVSLEKRKILSSFSTANPIKKYLYLNSEFSKLIKANSSELDSNTLLHDAITSNIAKSFMKLNTFYDCELSHDYIDHQNWNYSDVLDPDATLFGKKRNYNFKIALEVELTQKSKTRIFEKFESYVKSEYFDSVLYFFNKESVFRSYNKRKMELIDMNQDNLTPLAINKKIFLCFRPNLLNENLNLNESEIIIGNKSKRFGDVFHD